MSRPSWRSRATLSSLPLLGLTVALSSGCELIANLQARKVAVADGSDAGPTVTDLSACEVTGTGKGRLRFGNLVPNEDRMDVCLRPTAEGSFANVKPFFRSQASASCQGGMQYKDVTKAFEVPPDTYELRVVKAGSETCDTTEIASLPQVIVGEDKPTAVYVFGDGQSKPTVRRFVEDRPSNLTSSLVRVLVTTQEFGDSADFGVLAARTVPQDIVKKYLVQIPYGNTVPSGTTDVKFNENGYVNDASNGGTPFFGIGKTGGKGEIGIQRKMAPGSAYTFFLTGRSTNPDFPLELFACEETANKGALASCSDGATLTVAVQTIGVNLTGAFAALEGPRRPAIAKAIASVNADAVCVTDIWSDKDKAAVIEAAKSKFPYSYYPATTFSTPIDDRLDLSGKEPPAPTTAACSDSDSHAAMGEFVKCLQDHCSSESATATPDKPTTEAATAPGYNPSSCMSDHCYELTAKLVLGYPNCWTCIFGQYNSYETMADIKKTCGVTPPAPTPVPDTFFRGNSPTLVLSRYPISSPEHRVLPGSGWRPSIVRAPLKLDNGATLDFYCAQPTSVFDQCVTYFGKTIPRYGGDATNCVDGYVNQQKLVMTRIREWITARSGPTRAKTVVAGSFASGPAIGDVITAVQPENFSLLSGLFSLGIPVGHQPECTQCADNAVRGQDPNSAASANFWTTHNLLWNIPHTDVRSMQVNLKEPVVDATAATNGAVPAVPISVNYGLRSEVRVAP